MIIIILSSAQPRVQLFLVGGLKMRLCPQQEKNTIFSLTKLATGGGGGHFPYRPKLTTGRIGGNFPSRTKLTTEFNINIHRGARGSR